MLGASASSGALPASPETLVLSGDEPLRGEIVADEIVVPIGCCRFDGDLTLRATGSIRVQGSLAPLGRLPWNLTLVAGKDIIILGNVITGPGADAPTVTTVGSTTGEDGQDGGDITLQWGPGGVFTLADGALVRSGVGGAGASVVAGGNGGGEISGGTGGDGGRLRLDGALQVMYGILRVGQGGRGGDVSLGDAQGEWVLRGGAGGRSHFETRSPLVDLQTLASATIEEATGGAGGAVRSTACVGVEAVGGAGGSGWRGGDGGDASVGSLACRVQAGSFGLAGCPGGNGAPGADAPAIRAIGGPGGVGFDRGGEGGHATALALSGGDGGDGGAGGSCAGGDGGRGGSSGVAEAVGGAGGCAVLVRGGFGGGASAGAGYPGRGGLGGSGSPAGRPGTDGAYGAIGAAAGPNGGLC